jgi:hypothetical protein
LSSFGKLRDVDGEVVETFLRREVSVGDGFDVGVVGSVDLTSLL